MNPISNENLHDIPEISNKPLESEEIEIVNIPSSSATSTAVQEVWDEQLAIITEIVTTLNTDPSSLEEEDLYKLLDALNELINLAQNGITDATGKTYYLTNRMGDALKMLLLEFKQVGITPNMTVPQEDPIGILMAAAAPPGTDPYADPLQIALMGATGLTKENLSLQNYLYATVMDEILPVYGAEFEALYDFLGTSDQVLQLLDDILKITTYTEIPEPWGYKMPPENPGDIPPDAAQAIDLYIKNNTDPNNEDDAYFRSFYTVYQKELRIATANSEANGTTVQYEMSLLQEGITETITLPGGIEMTVKYNSSSQILKAFLKDDPERVADITQIMVESTVKQVGSVPTPPDGMTMSEVGEDLWDLKTDLVSQIESLTAQGADPKLIEALTQVNNDIDAAWNATIDGYISNGHDLGPPPYTPESIQKYAPDFYEGVMRDFANQFILTSSDTKSGGSTVTHIESAITRFESFNEEQLKELQKLMVALESLMKQVGQMMKTLQDSLLAIIKNFAR